MNYRVFFLEASGKQRIGLRRYRSPDGEDSKKCSGRMSYHNKVVWIGEAAEQKDSDGYIQSVSPDVYADDPRWPAQCDCGYVFDPADPADKDQVFSRTIYRRTDNGQEMILDEAPAGAIWNAWWMLRGDADRAGPDGMYLMCKMPGDYDWAIDGRASNCDSPCKHCGKPYHVHPIEGHHYEDARPHKCWIRQGTLPNITVGKNGITCGAGAGSIVVPGWHGFLINGELRQC